MSRARVLLSPLEPACELLDCFHNSLLRRARILKVRLSVEYQHRDTIGGQGSLAQAGCHVTG